MFIMTRCISNTTTLANIIHLAFKTFNINFSLYYLLLIYIYQVFCDNISKNYVTPVKICHNKRKEEELS